MERFIYKRLIIDEIMKYLPGQEILVLQGARQVGKTHILLYLERMLKEKGETTHFIDLEDSRFVRILDEGIDSLLKYLAEENFFIEKFNHQKRLYLFIDEIQYLNNPSSLLKLMADHYPQIKLIVSGSSSFEIKNKFSDSLVGRTINFEIYNLSFEEFLIFKKYNFVKGLELTDKKNDELRELYKDYVLWGGYPKIVLEESLEIKEKYLQQIIDTYVRKDIRDLAKIKDIGKFNNLLEVLAGQSGGLLNIAELANTCQISKQTVENYLFILEQTYIIRLVRPFSKNIRSEISKMPKIFFYDTGLMQLLWMKKIPQEILGNVFETSIFGELVKKFSVGNVFYWRTTDKKEIDFIVVKSGELLPIEVKMNTAQFKLSAFNYFKENYNVKNGLLVALNDDSRKGIFPWQI